MDQNHERRNTCEGRGDDADVRGEHEYGGGRVRRLTTPEDRSVPLRPHGTYVAGADGTHQVAEPVEAAAVEPTAPSAAGLEAAEDTHGLE